MKSRVEEVFHEVADLPAAARARYFAEFGVDTETRREVEALLAYDDDSSEALEEDISHIARRALAQFEPRDLLCGAYRIHDLLGSGGMGTVYSAERVDGEISQRVAVKLLRPGADDPQLRERFLTERQILAGLSHPNIARLLDAGHRDDGRPYLVMEYVDGSPIDTYSAGLGIRDKIRLFLKVCDAVSYLHRNLVVHRDLKPANILVTPEGEPKLLDFGISKMLNLASDSTATVMRMLTPDYASPEQVMGGPVSTATDIFSVAAVLYRLLTGRSPHHFESQGSVALAIAHGKITPPSMLAAAVKGDLEMILMKALRTEPQERYTTIEQFAEDLESYLESRPIRARRGEWGYRARKFVRRYWLPVAAASLAVAGLTAGALVANRQRAIAQGRFVQVRQLANKLFDIDAEVRRTPGTTKARQLIVETSLDYLRRVAGDARLDPELALEVGNAYMRVARVQGVPITANLGQMAQADENLRKAEEFIGAVLAKQPANRTAILRAAQIAHDRMLIARLSNRSPEALAFAQKSAQWLDRFHPEPGDRAEATAMLITYLNVADQHVLSEQYAEALRLCNRGSDAAREFGDRPHIGTFFWTAAEAFRLQGDLEEALKQIRQSVEKLDTGLAPADPSVLTNFALALIKEGRILGGDRTISMGRSEEALAPLERAFGIADEFAHRDQNDQNSRGRIAMGGLLWAGILRHSDAARSLAVYDHILRHLSEIGSNSSFLRYEASALAGSSYALLRLNRAAEARIRLDGALARLSQLKIYPAEQIDPGSEADETLCALANYEAAQGRLPRAIEIYEELLAKALAWQPKPDTSLRDAVDLSRIYADAAALNRRAGRTDRASELEARRLDLWRRWDRRTPDSSFVRRQLNLAKAAVD